jgi:hypothetical protein
MANLILVAPERGPIRGPSVFLAGGITGSPRWQDEVVAYFERAIDGITVCNPRRPRDFEDQADEYERQVTWELDHLLTADLALFWFPAAECRITRIELGLIIGGGRPVVVGADPQFVSFRYLSALTRRLNLPLHTSLDDLCEAARHWLAAHQSVHPAS